jgi:ABC-type Fe3+ transport system substrate-binding protein
MQAMLVLDFMLSKQGQKMRQDLGYVGTRPDMVDKARGLPSKIHHLDMRPNYDAEYKKWSALKKVFGKAKKRPKMKKK